MMVVTIITINAFESALTKLRMTPDNGAPDDILLKSIILKWIANTAAFRDRYKDLHSEA